LAPTNQGFSNNVQLRILTLGASIAYGYTSPNGNGFRFGVRNQLVCAGNPVNMIGSRQSGTMIDNDVEGWPGARIDQVTEKAELSIPSQPNLVLLHVGTNDMLQDFNVSTAHLRLGALIDHLFDTIPGVTVICSTLLPNLNAAAETNAQFFNSKIPGLVTERQKAGKKILQADFSSFSASLIGADGTHPTSDGYVKMAGVWYQKILGAAASNWITAPANVSGVTDVVAGNSGCQTTGGP
jgi:lysophospholipase L1-like esterase